MSNSVFLYVLAFSLIGATFGFAQTTAPEATLVAIQQAIQSGRYPEATQLLSKALATYPKDPVLFNLRGAMQAQRQELSEARKDFERAVRLAPDLATAWQNLGRSCQLLVVSDPSAYQCASDAWHRVLTVSPSDVEARFSLAELNLWKGKYAESLLEIQKLPLEEQNRTPTLVMQLRDQLGLGRQSEAQAVVQRLAASPEFLEDDLKPVLPSLSEPAAAPVVVTLVEALDAKGAASASLLRVLVVADEQLERWSDARKILERLAVGDPKNPQHLLELARVAYRMHDLEGSLGYLGHARDLLPNDAKIHFLFGMVLVDMELPMEARKSVMKAIELDPSNPDFDYGMGSIILRTREPASAVPYFTKYVKARPQDPLGQFALGVAYFSAGEYEQSKAVMLPLLREPKVAGGAAYFLGRLARIDNELDQAANYLSQAIAQLPEFSEAQTELARVRIRQDRIDEATTAVNRALTLNRDSFQANSTLLVIYERTHDPRAEEQKERLKKLDEERGKHQELMLRSIEVKPY